MEALYTSSQRQFHFFVLISLILHIVVFAGLLFFPNMFLSKPTYIKEAIRVDVVGLPDLVRSQKKSAPQKKAVVKKIPKKSVKKPVKKALKKAVEKKQDSSQIKSAQSAAIESLKDFPEQEPPQTYKGERISKGESAEGEVDDLLVYGYFTRARAHIKMLWNVPRHLADKDLKTIVVIEVNSNGNIMRIRLEKSSGHPAFDQIVIDAISMASPLPPPPPEMVKMLRQGVGFNFP